MKKIASKFVLLFAVLLTVVCLSPVKANAADFAGGKGTKTSPYIITTYDQLCRVNYLKYKGCYFKQARDINCAGKKIPTLFGSSFTGNYNGNNKKIMNISVDSSYAYVGRDIASTGVIRNLVFYKPVLKGVYMATIFDNNYGTLSNVSVVKGKFTTNFKSSISIECYSEVTGLVKNNKRTGVISNCKVTDCSLVANVDVWRGIAQVTGITVNNEGTIINSTVKNATMKALSNEYTGKIGGICSWNNGGKVVKCTVKVKLAKARGDKYGHYGAVEYGEVGKLVHTNEGLVKKCKVVKAGKWTGDKKVKVIFNNKGRYIK